MKKRLNNIPTGVSHTDVYDLRHILSSFHQ